MNIESNEIKALIQLLDDPNEEIFVTIKQQLMAKGEDIIPHLEKAWESSYDEFLQDRIETIIQHIQFDSTLNKLAHWSKGGGLDLIKGAYYIAKYQYPDLKLDDIQQKVAQIREDIWLELNENLTALEKVKILNHIIFDINNFTRNSSNFHSPQNSYINDVLTTKKGSAVSLAIIYSSIAQSLELPIYGVNLPKNFILAYKEEYNMLPTFEDGNDDILFYINPFNKGTVFGSKEIEYFITQQKLEPNASYFLPCSNVEIIGTLIGNLIFSYEKLGYPEKIEDLQRLRDVLQF